MKILHIAPDRKHIGGISKYVAEIIDYKESIKNHDLLFIDSYIFRKNVTYGNITKISFTRLYETLKFSFYILKYTLKNKIDIIHIHSSSFFGFYEKSFLSILLRLIGKKTVFHVHGGSFTSFYKKSKFKFFIRLFLKVNNKIVFVSMEHMDLINISKKKVVYIPNSIIINDIETSININKDFLILTMSVLEKRKDINYIIDACTSLIDKGYTNIKLLIAGNGSEYENLKTMSSKYKDNIIFLGYVIGKEKDTMLSESSLFIQMSESESFGISVIEAMAFGNRIITTKVGIIKNLPINSLDIKVVPIKGINELTRQLESEILKKHGKSIKNREYVIDNFSLETCLEALEKIYDELNN